MKKNNVQGVICLAVDPFQDRNDYHRHALNVVMPLARSLNLAIQPVSFIDQDQVYINNSDLQTLSFDEYHKLVEAAVKARFKQIFSKTQLALMSPPKVLLAADFSDVSLQGKIEAIDRYASSVNASFVALQSHARSGVKRFFLGSFAETFVLKSKHSTLLFNPNCIVVKHIKSLVFPTDFASGASRSFMTAIQYAKKMQVKLEIISVAIQQRLSVFLSGDKIREQFKQENRQHKQGILRQGDLLLKLAKKNRVPADFLVLDAKSGESPAKVINKYLDADSNSIVLMAAKSTELQASIVGSMSRELARSSARPVLILR